MPAGGSRPNSGRKKLENKKQFLGVKIPHELLEKVKNQDLPSSQIVEAALIKYFEGK